MPIFRLLHASDLHYAAMPFRAGSPASGWLGQLARYWRLTSHDPAVVRAFVQFAHVNRAALDALVITGDLATTGDLVDLRAVQTLFTAPALGPTHLTGGGNPTLAYWSN